MYRALDTRLGRDVAVKVLPPELSREPAFKERFEREARTISQLQHPHVCALYDIGSTDGMDYLVMEYLVGETLEVRLGRGPLPVLDGVRIGVEIAEAVEAAHRKGVVHRDLKPGNVMLTDTGTKVLDFGLAREVTTKQGSVESSQPEADTLAMPATLTLPGQILGTVPYMSPEQLHGEAIAPCSDVFSLGIVLYEMFTGARPFLGNTQAAQISSILRDAPPPPSAVVEDLPRGLDSIVGRCLEKDPERRYPSAAEVRSSLQSVRRDLDSGTSRPVPNASEPATRSYRTPLYGRSTESRELDSALERAASGSGSMVTLAGEPGVGKTRLSAELMDQARGRGFIALVGHCYEGEGARPYSPWVELLDATVRIAPKDALRDVLGDAAPEIAKLQALPHAYAYRPDDNLRALELLRQALALDPGFAPASAHAAWCYEQRLTSGWATTVDGDAERAVTLARQAVGADNLDARSMALAGFVLVMVQGDYDAGMTIMQRGLELNPGDASLATLSGWAHCVAGNLDAAEAEFRRALRFSPADPMAYQMLTGEAFVHLREDYERAVTSIRHAATRSADWADLHLVLTIAYAHLGKDEEARAAAAKLRQLEPGVSQTEKVRVFRDEGHRRIIVEGLAKAGF